MKRLLFIFLVIFIKTTQAQVAINNSAATPASSSMLDVSSTTKGMLMPRMTSAQRKAILNPEMGLLVYDIEKQTIYLFDGVQWKPFMFTSENKLPLIIREPQGAYANGSFGKAVAIYGDYAVVGAPSDSAAGVFSGTVYIFGKENGIWVQQAKLYPSGGTDGDGFGSSVAMYDNTIVVGAPFKAVSGISWRGRVYVFKRTNRTWSQAASLTASNGTQNDKFGHAVTFNGQYMAVGAPAADYGNTPEAGAVYIFGLTNNVWTQKAIVGASGTPDWDARFGTSLDLYGTTLVVGAPRTHTGNAITGAVFIYNNTDINGFTWTAGQRLDPGNLANDYDYGASVAIDGNTLLIGIPKANNANTAFNSGMVDRYVKTLGTWQYSPNYLELVAGNLQGGVVAIDGTNEYFNMNGWQNKGRVALGFNRDSRKYFTDEDADANRVFGVALSAQNGQFIIGSVPPGNSTTNGAVFFGKAE